MRTADLSALFADRGAVFPGGDDSAPVLTFGDVPGEYRAGRESALLLDASARGRVVATGGDRADFLHRILANTVRGLEAGSGNRGLLLTPKGKVVEAFDLCVEPERIVLEAEAGRGASLLAAVDMFLFSEDVQLTDASDSTAPLELCGPDAARIAEDLLGDEPPSEPGHWKERGSVRVACAIVAGSRGFRLDAGPDGATELWERLVRAGATPGGLIAADSLRAEAGQARYGVDVDDNVYPQEARLESAFSLDKGCYTGQEVVAKIDTYGGVNKRLVTVRLASEDPVARGTVLTVPGEDGEPRQVGIVTTWAYSFELDAPIALAFAKRRHQKIGTVLDVADGSGTATVVAMPVRKDGEPVTGEFEE
ncbi:Aminomethyltransferase [Planctomycetes bacterium Pla163]|uniref:Aminomethyltransferase n=1 Tax=Rohdeia mirabilis TaxID=2528008 RepID=A0A518D235_9BACT|nr:Aminomethyltransferase [Planctomycetes bacterium Pla163]